MFPNGFFVSMMEITMKVVKYEVYFKKQYISLIKSLWNDITLNEIEQIITEHFEKNNTIFLAVIKDRAIGFLNSSIRTDYVEGSQSSPVGYIEGLYVQEAYRMKQVATKLVETTINYFRQIGLSEIGSDTEFANTISASFHKKLGFKEEIIRTFIKRI